MSQCRQASRDRPACACDSAADRCRCPHRARCSASASRSSSSAASSATDSARSACPLLRYTSRILTRQAQQEDEVGGYHVPAGADVLVCPYALHRHPGFWEDPERFDPARSGSRPSYAYLPFGAGPRFCVGNSLGMMEAAFVLAMVARDLRLRNVSGYRVVPEPMLSLRVRGGLPMSVHAAPRVALRSVS